MSDDEEYPPSLQNIIDQRSLRWVFVGGKGGVGKTTTSCSLAVALSHHRKSVLLISTDPAHNLSDAFGQRFTHEPTLVEGYDNLYAMEIDPSVEQDTTDVLDDSTGAGGIWAELTASIPGIDEAKSFAELMKQVQTMEHETIVFDTAPTGHTLRLLSFPSVLEKALNKVSELKDRFSGVFRQFSSMLNLGGGMEEKVMSSLEETKATVESVNRQFADPDRTTFVCVCIPEFLSLFETERLVQELAKFNIDAHNVVVNQILMPEEGNSCRKCQARVKMQTKYLDQIDDLYDDFHVVKMPLLDEEVRGAKALEQFSGMLLNNPSS